MQMWYLPYIFFMHIHLCCEGECSCMEHLGRVKFRQKTLPESLPILVWIDIWRKGLRLLCSRIVCVHLKIPPTREGYFAQPISMTYMVNDTRCSHANEGKKPYTSTGSLVRSPNCAPQWTMYLKNSKRSKLWLLGKCGVWPWRYRLNCYRIYEAYIFR